MWVHPAAGGAAGFGTHGLLPSSPSRGSREAQQVPAGTRGTARPTLSMGPLFPSPRAGVSACWERKRLSNHQTAPTAAHGGHMKHHEGLGR